MKGTVFVAHCRSMLGTPWRHQGRIPGVAIDCWGLLVLAARLGAVPVEDVEGYGPEPLPEAFMAEVARRATQVTRGVTWHAGDALVVAFNGVVPQHLAVATGEGTLIHSAVANRKVVEQSIDDSWRRKILSAWRPLWLEDD